MLLDILTPYSPLVLFVALCASITTNLLSSLLPLIDDFSSFKLPLLKIRASLDELTVVQSSILLSVCHKTQYFRVHTLLAIRSYVVSVLLV